MLRYLFLLFLCVAALPGADVFEQQRRLGRGLNMGNSLEAPKGAVWGKAIVEEDFPRIKAAGFANVNDWNIAITTLGLAYSSVVDDQTPDLLLQIEEIEQDTEMAQDIKDRMIKALKALIPSDNNRKVIEDLLNDPIYGGKLKLLDTEEE
jgi:hypothetical protein